MTLLRAVLLLASAGSASAAVAYRTTTLSLSSAPNTFGSQTTPVYVGINAGAR